jgi:hypothetical protein
MASYATMSRHVLAVLLLLFTFDKCRAQDTAAVPSAAAAANDAGCAAMYANADRPLLFGGVHGGCTGNKCQPRTDEW